MLHNLAALLGSLSVTIIFALVAYWSVSHFAAGGEAIAKWKVFTTTSVLGLVVILGITWALTTFQIPSSNNVLNALSRIFSYSLFIGVIVSLIAGLTGAIGFVVLWLRSRGN